MKNEFILQDLKDLKLYYIKVIRYKKCIHRTQNPVSARTCRFDPGRRYSNNDKVCTPCFLFYLYKFRLFVNYSGLESANILRRRLVSFFWNLEYSMKGVDMHSGSGASRSHIFLCSCFLQYCNVWEWKWTRSNDVSFNSI